MESRTVLACNFPTPTTAFDDYDASSPAYVGSTDHSADCVSVTVRANDIISVQLELDGATRNGYPNTIVELLNADGKRVIGSKFGFVDLYSASNDNFDVLPMNPDTDVPWILATDVRTGAGRTSDFIHFVYHAATDGTYVAQVVPGAINGDYKLSVLKRRPPLEAYPNGARQYLYLNVSGVENLDLQPFLQNSTTDVTDIGDFLVRYGRGYLTDSAADIRLFTDAVVSYLENQFPVLKGSILNSLDHAPWKNLSTVSEIIVGDSIAKAVSTAQFEDQGNFALNDKALITLSPTSQSNLNWINSVVLCTNNCRSDFDGSPLNGTTAAGQKRILLSYLSQYVGRYVAHEFGHLIGNTHVLYPTSASQTHAIMSSPTVVDPLEGLETGRVYVGKTQNLDLRFGTSDDWLLQFYANFGNEQLDRTDNVMTDRGTAAGFWHNLTAGELYESSSTSQPRSGVDIMPGELIYTTASAEQVKIVSEPNGDVSVYQCQTTFSDANCGGPVLTEPGVTKVRLVSFHDISRFDSASLTKPLSVDGAWQAASATALDTDRNGTTVAAGELVYGGTHAAETVSLTTVNDQTSLRVNGDLLGTVENISGFRFIGRGGDDIVSSANPHVLTTFGDFDGDQRITNQDIDQLVRARNDKASSAAYDINRDGQVDDADVRYLVRILLDTAFGDTNLDGIFDSNDLIEVLVIGQYEDGVNKNSFWADGDWDGDGDFTTDDLVLALQEGYYRK